MVSPCFIWLTLLFKLFRLPASRTMPRSDVNDCTDLLSWGMTKVLWELRLEPVALLPLYPLSADIIVAIGSMPETKCQDILMQGIQFFYWTLTNTELRVPDVAVAGVTDFLLWTAISIFMWPKYLYKLPITTPFHIKIQISAHGYPMTESVQINWFSCIMWH